MVKREEDRDYTEGVEGIHYEIYKTETEGVFLKMQINTDSYGEDSYILGLQFVKPKEQIVQIFETI